MKPVTIGLLWHSLDSSNLGVGALTASQIRLVQDAASEAGVTPRFSLIGWNRQDTPRDDSPIDHICQVNAKSLLGLTPDLRDILRRCDLVLDIGEGDSFSDIYGWKRLLYLLGTKEVAFGMDKPLVLSPQTLGPFKGKIAAYLADRVMRRARLVVSRDRLSSDYFRSRKLRVPFQEAIDVAFALPFERMPKSVDGLRVGINVSGLLWAGGYTGVNQFDLALDYRQTVVDLVDYFHSQAGVKVVLVPHVVNQQRLEEDDSRASQEVAKVRTTVEIAGPFGSASEAKSYISGLDFFMGARMHACIAAFSSSVPVVPMAYSRKFAGLFDTLGYPHVADCRKHSRQDVVFCAKSCFERRGSLVPLIEQGNRLAAERLEAYKQALIDCFREVVNA